jgi:hypothetical protein
MEPVLSALLLNDNAVRAQAEAHYGRLKTEAPRTVRQRACLWFR